MDHFEDFRKWVGENYRTYGGAAADVANMPADMANLGIRAATDFANPSAKPFQFRTFNVPQPSSRSGRTLREALPYASMARDVPLMARNGLNMLLKNSAKKIVESEPLIDAGRRSFLKGAGATAAGGGAAALTGKSALKALTKVGASEANPTAAIVRAHLDAAKSHETAAAIHADMSNKWMGGLFDYMEPGEFDAATHTGKQASMQANEASSHELLHPEDEIAPDLENLKAARDAAHDAESLAHGYDRHVDEPMSSDELSDMHREASDAHQAAAYHHRNAAQTLLGTENPPEAAPVSASTDGLNMLLKNSAKKIVESEPPIDAGRRTFLKGAGATAAGGGAAALIGKSALKALTETGASKANPTAALVKAHLEAAKSHEAAAAIHRGIIHDMASRVEAWADHGDANTPTPIDDELIDAVNTGKEASMRANKTSHHDLLQDYGQTEHGAILAQAHDAAHDAEVSAHDSQELLDDPDEFFTQRGGEPAEPGDVVANVENIHQEASEAHQKAANMHILAAKKLLGQEPSEEELANLPTGDVPTVPR